jgi:hypothetical protein
VTKAFDLINAKEDSDQQFQAQIRQNSKTWGLKKKLL